MRRIRMGYLLICFHPWLVNVGGNLLTTRALAVAWTKSEREETSTSYPPLSVLQADGFEFGDDHDVADVYAEIMMPSWSGMRDYGLRELRHFFVIGQSLFALFVGLLAGWATAAVYALRVRKERRQLTSSEQPEAPHSAPDAITEDAHA